jgi:serine/threonine-protein kinase
MSPEQLRTPRGVDARTDIWSMGVILYELLTGRMPFTGEALGELFMQIMEGTAPSVRSLRPDVPAALDAAITRCLSRDPNARFQTVKELADILKVFASDQMRAILAARQSSPGAIAAGPLAETQPMVVTGNTAAPWANTDGTAGEATKVPDGKRARVVGIVAAGVLALTVGVVGASVVLKRAMHADPPAGGIGLAIDSAALPSPPATTIAVVTTAVPTLDAAPVATSRPQQPAAPVSPAVPKPIPAPKTTAGPATAALPTPAAPAAPAAPKNCNPNYYFDKDGRKHFKAECF